MNYVVDDIGAVIARLRTVENGQPYYLYGPNLEVAKELVKKDTAQKGKYPLFVLNMPFPEKKENGLIFLTLNIAIVAFTKMDYRASDRYDKVIKPILYPLYEAFIVELRKSGLFQWERIGGEPSHTKIDRPFWGTQYSQGNKAHIFNDPLDAIEILDLKITQKIKC